MVGGGNSDREHRWVDGFLAGHRVLICEQDAKWTDGFGVLLEGLECASSGRPSKCQTPTPTRRARRPRADDRGTAESPGRREGEGLVGPAPLTDDRLNRATEPVEVDGLAQIRIEGLGLQIVLLES